MNYLLDTCVLAELIKPRPNAGLTDWIQSQIESSFHISVLSLGEIAKGIEKAPSAARKAQLKLWLQQDLKQRFQHRILPVDEQVAITWGKIQAVSEKQGRPMPSIDGLIAATALTFNLAVVTRNTKDMQAGGVVLINPWS